MQWFKTFHYQYTVTRQLACGSDTILINLYVLRFHDKNIKRTSITSNYSFIHFKNQTNKNSSAIYVFNI